VGAHTYAERVRSWIQGASLIVRNPAICTAKSQESRSKREIKIGHRRRGGLSAIAGAGSEGVCKLGAENYGGGT